MEKWEPSCCKLLDELGMGVTHFSDMCNAAGTHILLEVWNCQRQSHTLSAPSWPNFKAPGRHAKAVWQSMLQSLFILLGHSHCQMASPLGDRLNPLDNHWIWWNDPETDTLWEHRQPHEWHTWTALPCCYQHHHFSRLPPAGPSGTPATLQDAILALPPTCLWAVQHAKSDDHGAIVAQAIAQGTAMAVSDGFLRCTLGTSAFVIEGTTSDHHVIGYNRVLGPVEEGDSHRCELAGLCAIISTDGQLPVSSPCSCQWLHHHCM